MSPTVDALIAQARLLSSDEFDLLMVRLEHEVAPPADPGVEDAWMAEIQRRVDAMDRGEAKFHEWEDVRKDLGLK